MNEFKPGELVDITIKGVRIVSTPIKGQTIGFTITDERGNNYRLPPQAAAERVAPAEWPPQEKDVWRDRDGDNWFGLLVDDDDTVDEPYVQLSAGRNSKRWLSGDDWGIKNSFGPLTLVYRDESSGEEVSEP